MKCILYSQNIVLYCWWSCIYSTVLQYRSNGKCENTFIKSLLHVISVIMLVKLCNLSKILQNTRSIQFFRDSPLHKFCSRNQTPTFCVPSNHNYVHIVKNRVYNFWWYWSCSYFRDCMIVKSDFNHIYMAILVNDIYNLPKLPIVIHIKAIIAKYIGFFFAIDDCL